MVKALVMDIDGSLTDGGIYIGAQGEVMKRFHVRDGYGIKHILPKYGIVPIVITGRESIIVKRRCEELNIVHLYQGSQDKVRDLKKVIEYLDLDMSDVAYFGDDVNDFDAMKMVGVKGCPKDAVMQIIEIADFVSEKNGGDGAVREFIEWISEWRNYTN